MSKTVGLSSLVKFHTSGNVSYYYYLRNGSCGIIYKKRGRDRHYAITIIQLIQELQSNNVLSLNE